MINRKNSKYIAEIYELSFTYLKKTFGSGPSYTTTYVRRNEFHDFLYENEYEPWFLGKAKTVSGKRAIQDLIMDLHTGESIASVTLDWDWPSRQRLGQTVLEKLAEDVLINFEKLVHMTSFEINDQLLGMKAELDLAGYVFENGVLRKPEMDAIDVKEIVGVLEGLYGDLNLPNKDIAFRNLNLSEEYFLTEKWEDCISNARKFLESCLVGVAQKYNEVKFKTSLDVKTCERPVSIREYLEKNKLLETREKEALDKIYGLLSHTGSHPYMAKDDQARLLRNLALTFSQFALLRFKGFLNSLH